MKNIYITLLLVCLFSLFCSSAEINYHVPPRYYTRVYTGLENFIRNYADKYKGKRTAIVTNHSGVDFYLRKNIDLLREKGLDIAVAFAPEHGLYGYQNQYDRKLFREDKGLNLIIYNLHHLNINSLRHLLKVADIVVFDIQDMGMRCYTYISSLKMVMDAMKGSGKELIVLDRPNPIGFLGVDGPYLEREFYSRHVSSFPSTLIYGMTIGEAAVYYKELYVKKLNLTLIPMKNYSRNMLYNETMLPWVPPSPNLPTYESSIVYSFIVMLEGINLSLGRGTAKPFEYIGAPWIEPESFCKDLKSLNIGCLSFRPVYFKPTFSVYSGETCGGAQIFYGGGKFSPLEISYRLIKFIKERYNKKFQWTRRGRFYGVDRLAGTDRFRKAIDRGRAWGDFVKEIEKGVKRFKDMRSRYLIYD